MDGRYLGKVVDVIRKTTENHFNTLIVKEHFFSKAYEIPHKHVSVSKKNIMLNMSYPKESEIAEFKPVKKEDL